MFRLSLGGVESPLSSLHEIRFNVNTDNTKYLNIPRIITRINSFTYFRKDNKNLHKKKSQISLTLSLTSGKRGSVHLLPTLYIKQLPLPSTILPIQGTFGLFQGVVFRSDFCHTNFRTTVAYDKFTNNF